MQSNRVWIAVLLFAIFSLSYPVKAQENKAPEDPASQRAEELLKKLTLDEKLQFILSKYPSNANPGGGVGYIEGVTRLHIPDVNISDSATGSGSATQLSTTFPSTIALAASWDRKLSYDYGKEVAIQLRAQGFAMGLGGAANLTREPLRRPIIRVFRRRSDTGGRTAGATHARNAEPEGDGFDQTFCGE